MVRSIRTAFGNCVYTGHIIPIIEKMDKNMEMYIDTARRLAPLDTTVIVLNKIERHGQRNGNVFLTWRVDQMQCDTTSTVEKETDKKMGNIMELRVFVGSVGIHRDKEK